MREQVIFDLIKTELASWLKASDRLGICLSREMLLGCAVNNFSDMHNLNVNQDKAVYAVMEYLINLV